VVENRGSKTRLKCSRIPSASRTSLVTARTIVTVRNRVPREQDLHQFILQTPPVAVPHLVPDVVGSQPVSPPLLGALVRRAL
jgi:hypothetical protein